MPTITQTQEVELSPVGFLDIRSPLELRQIHRLIHSPRFKNIIEEFDKGAAQLAFERSKYLKHAKHEHLCKTCENNPVDADNGQEHCLDCYKTAVKNLSENS